MVPDRIITLAGSGYDRRRCQSDVQEHFGSGGELTPVLREPKLMGISYGREILLYGNDILRT